MHAHAWPAKAYGRAVVFQNRALITAAVCQPPPCYKNGTCQAVSFPLCLHDCSATCCPFLIWQLLVWANFFECGPYLITLFLSKADSKPCFELKKPIYLIGVYTWKWTLWSFWVTADVLLRDFPSVKSQLSLRVFLLKFPRGSVSCSSYQP